MLIFSEQARNRIQDGLKKYSRIVQQARQRGMNERDTSDIVKAMLGDMLGYDPFFDVTAEVAARGPNADHAILLEGQLKCLLIVKGINTTPHVAHLLRLSGISAPPYADWVILTNADSWGCYRLGVGPDRHPELVFRVALFDTSPPEEKAAAFFLVSKEGMEQDALRTYWERNRALNPGRLASLLLSEQVLHLLRKEIQRTANHRVDRDTLIAILTREVLRPEALAARGGSEAVPNLPQCFAYVADANDLASWRLPYRNADGTPNPEHLMRAASELAGDPRSLQIPGDDLPFVKERLRSAYLELGIAAEDIPVVLRR